jgi:hypothetical protein
MAMMAITTKSSIRVKAERRKALIEVLLGYRTHEAHHHWTADEPRRWSSVRDHQGRAKKRENGIA